MTDPSTTLTPAIIIVDDEARLASLFCFGLSGLFKVHSTVSPAEALALSDIPSVKIVLTDYQMDGMNGVELISKIKARRPDVVCILFSGNLTVERWTAAINTGCRHVLEKPLSIKSIIDLCSSIVGAPEANSPSTAGKGVLHTLAWQEALGKNLQSLATHLKDGAGPLFLVTPDGRFPCELLALLAPSLRDYPAPPDAPPPEDAVHYTQSLQTIPPAGQNAIGQTTRAARRGKPWLLAANATPDELIDRHEITETLYLRLNQAIFHLPAPGANPADTLLLCTWWLSSLPAPATLTDEGADWLSGQLQNFDWHTLVAILKQALLQTPGQPIDALRLQHAALAVSLGSDFSQIQRYADFFDAYTRDLRQAWNLLGAVQP
jgi:two-component system response regulator FixJ